MKRLLIIAALGLATAPVLAQESLEDVLDCNYESRGGYDAIKDVDSAKFTGTMTMGPMQAPFTIWFKRPQMVRMEFEVQGMTAVQAFDGETGWSVMPFLGKTTPEKMPEDEVKNVKDMADLDGPLVDWKDKGHEVTYRGKEEAQGTEAHVLHVVRESGDEETIYLDTDYCLTFMEKATREVQGNEMKTTTEVGNYKEVEGLVLPFSLQTKLGEAAEAPTQAITISEADLNLEIPDDKFTMPEVEEQPAGEESAEEAGEEPEASGGE